VLKYGSLLSAVKSRAYGYRYRQHYSRVSLTSLGLAVGLGLHTGENIQKVPNSYTRSSCLFRNFQSRAGSEIERIDPLSFLAGCRESRLNQALSVLSLSLCFFECVCCAVT